MSNNEYTKRLENVIKQMLQPLKDIPFNLVIESMTGKKVISFDDEKTIFNMLYKCGFIFMNRYSGSSSESYYYWDSVQGGFFRPGFIDINKNDIIEINYNELKNRLDQFKK